MRLCCLLLLLASVCEGFIPPGWGLSFRACQILTPKQRRRSSGVAMVMGGLRSSRAGLFQNGKDTLSYDLYSGEENPGVMYLPALDCPKSDLKATTIKRYCQSTRRSYLSADWFGVGQSSGDFTEGTVTRWTADTIKLLETLCPDTKTVLVGGGVGGWVACLVALERPDLVAGIVGLGADPDFTENLLWKELPEATKAEIMEKGVSEITWGIHQYPISRALIEDGRKHLLLDGPSNELDISCPVRLIHGLQDEEVPLSVPLGLARRITSQNVQVLIQKTGDHFLSAQEDFKLIKNALQDCIANFFEYDLTTPGSG